MNNLSLIIAKVLQFLDKPHFVRNVLILGVGLRILWIALVHPNPISDCGWYYDRAISIASGEGYAVDGKLTAYWPVGYSAFLGLLFRIAGPSIWLPVITNVLISAGTLWLGYKITHILFPSERVANLTLLIMALHPNQIAYNSLLFSEIFFTGLFLLAIYLQILCEKRKQFTKLYLLSSGLIYGFATLVKPQALVFPFILFCTTQLWGLKGIRIKHFAYKNVLVYSMLILVLTPWTIRNFGVFDHFVMVSNNGGVNLLIGNNPEATGNYFGVDYFLNNILSDDEYASDQLAKSTAKEYILANPFRILVLLPRKLGHLYFEDSEGMRWNEKGLISPEEVKTYFNRQKLFYKSVVHSPFSTLWNTAKEEPKRLLFFMLMALSNMYYLIVFLIVLGSVGSTLLRKRFVDMILGDQNIPFILILSFTGICLVFFGIPRFHFPIMPFLFMIASVGAIHFLEKRTIKEAG